jgi:hypothetical protein
VVGSRFLHWVGYLRASGEAFCRFSRTRTRVGEHTLLTSRPAYKQTGQKTTSEPNTAISNGMFHFHLKNLMSINAPQTGNFGLDITLFVSVSYCVGSPLTSTCEVMCKIGEIAITVCKMNSNGKVTLIHL